MKNRRILYLITQSKFGGAQRYTLDLAYFSSLNNAVMLAVGCPEEQDQAFFSQARAKNLEPRLLQTLQRDINPIKNLQSIGEIYKLLSEFQPDIIHINSSMAGFTGSLAAWLYNLSHRKSRVRVVYTAHGFVFNEPLPAWQKTLYLWLERISAHFKDAIISVSDFDKISAVKHRVAPAKKITTVHNGVQSEDYNFLDKDAARATLKLPDSRPIIGTIASCYPTKGLNYLIVAAELMPEAMFIIIGDGPEKPELMKTITDRQLNDRVKMMGALPQAAQYLKAFDIFVLPSVKEGLAYVILEAGLAQLPVVVTDAGGNSEIVTDKLDGRVVPIKDSPALAQALQETWNLPDHGHDYGLSLGHQVETEFSQRQMIDRTEAIYDRLFN